jgi:hypothetical protein
VGNTAPQISASGIFKGTVFHFEPGKNYSLKEDVADHFQRKGMITPTDQPNLPKGRADVGPAEKKGMEPPENK